MFLCLSDRQYLWNRHTITFIVPACCLSVYGKELLPQDEICEILYFVILLKFEF